MRTPGDQDASISQFGEIGVVLVITGGGVDAEFTAEGCAIDGEALGVDALVAAVLAI